jgi:predicted alpha/beta superfamily hydrolase
LQHEGLLPRDVVVLLPPDYEQTTNRYPLLYMHDGQNIVDPGTSAFGIDWQVDETLTQLIEEKKIKPMIVVGIYNTSERSKDYLPGAQGTKYENFVCEQLKPLIDKTYRTDPARQATAIAGSSAGGICAFTMAWNRPDVFSKAICMSPAFQYHRPDGSLSADYLQEFTDAKRPPSTPFFYIDNGGVGLELLLQPGIDEVLAELKNKGLQVDKDYVWKSNPDARHDESAWAKRMPAALQMLFGVD